MKNLTLLGRHAITTYPDIPHYEYIMSGKNIIGFAEKREDSGWDFYEFGVADKNSKITPDPIFKKTVKQLSEILEED
jgi:hypothetical protein